MYPFSKRWVAIEKFSKSAEPVKISLFATLDNFVAGAADFNVTSGNPFYVIRHMVLANYRLLDQEVAKSAKHDYSWISYDCNIIAIYY